MSENRFKIGDFEGTGSVWPTISGPWGVPTNHSSCPKTRWMDLLYDIRMFSLSYFVLLQCTRLTDRQTDRHIPICLSVCLYVFTVRMHSQSHGKKSNPLDCNIGENNTGLY